MRSLGIAAGPFGALSVPNPLMMLYAGIYTLLMLALAIRQFNHRDLKESLPIMIKWLTRA
jgi:hypothetical protein